MSCAELTGLLDAAMTRLNQASREDFERHATAVSAALRWLRTDASAAEDRVCALDMEAVRATHRETKLHACTHWDRW